MIQSEENNPVNSPFENLQQYANQLEQAIIKKQQAIEYQRGKFYEIIKKVSFDLDMQNVDPTQVENYLKTITIIPEDFDEPFQRRKNKNNIIRISKQEIQKVIQEQQQQQSIQEAPKKQKRKYNKKSSEEKQVQKRKRRTKKEMEEARMLELKQL